MGKRKKKITHKFEPKAREPRFAEANNPTKTDNETIGWQFFRCDQDHELWGWEKSDIDIKEIIGKLHAFETMTWGEIKAQSGGRKQGTNHHNLLISGFTKEARNRLEELKLDDIDTLFSLRLQGKIRLYGIQDGRILRFIWHDPYHGSAKGAYPTKK